MTRLVDLTGQRFGRLTVLERAPSPSRKNAAWLCRCDCGTETVVLGYALRSGHTSACGCQRIVHGHAKRGAEHPLYQTWAMMIQRCTNPNDKGWPYYGGRGITVCARWRGSFANFLADMGERPEGKTLDRIDNNGNYEPGNCRWATAKEQQSNTRARRR